MKSLMIEAIPDSPYYPEVNFDASNGVCLIQGESYMEEAYKFYMPLLDWLKEFAVEENNKVTLNVMLTYFNTNSSRLLLDMFDILKKSVDAGNVVEINWYYEEDDPDIMDEVEDFEIETGLEINMIPFQA
ncbi:MAG: DUF1987 domain-containing protein [Bacteroidales bacterium]|nr:DUF1987 domain-containing protein [Bacteroidales bacterium]